MVDDKLNDGGVDSMYHYTIEHLVSTDETYSFWVGKQLDVGESEGSNVFQSSQSHRTN